MNKSLLAICIGILVIAVTTQAAPPKDSRYKQTQTKKDVPKSVDLRKKSPAPKSSSTAPQQVEQSTVGGSRVLITTERALGDNGVDLGGGPGPALAATIQIQSFAINHGQLTTTGRSVTLDIDAINNPSHYRASESSYLAGVAWQPFTPRPSFMLSPGQGNKTVYLELMGPSVPSPNIQGVMLANRATSNDQIKWEIPDTVYHGNLVYRHHALNTELARGEATLTLPGYPIEDAGEGTLSAEESFVMMLGASNTRPCTIPFTGGAVGFQAEFTTQWQTFGPSTRTIKWRGQPGNQVTLEGFPGQGELKVSTPTVMRFSYQKMMPTQTGSHTSLCLPQGPSPPPQTLLEAASPPELVDLEWHLVRQN